MTLSVRAPLAGTVVAVEDVPDPVFAGRFVGPGLAIDPERGSGEVTAVAPVAGRISKVHPHAFVVQAADGTGVLVHLGLDTVSLAGQGYTVRVAAGDEVAVGDPVVSWDPAAVEAAGLSPLVPVVVLEGDEAALAITAPGTAVAAGERIIAGR